MFMIRMEMYKNAGEELQPGDRSIFLVFESETRKKTIMVSEHEYNQHINLMSYNISTHDTVLDMSFYVVVVFCLTKTVHKVENCWKNNQF